MSPPIRKGEVCRSMKERTGKNKMLSFVARFSISGRCTIRANGNSVKNAIDKAEALLRGADFGVAEETKWAVVYIEDADGNIVYDSAVDSLDQIEANAGVFFIRYKVSASYTTPVSAPNIQSVISDCENIFFSANFGALETLDGELVSVQNVEEKYIYMAA